MEANKIKVILKRKHIEPLKQNILIYILTKKQ